MLVDPEQIRRAGEGDNIAFTDVVVAYRKRVLGTISRLIGDSQPADGMADEVFRRLHTSLKGLPSTGAFEPWLYRLTVNAAYEHLRKKGPNN